MPRYLISFDDGTMILREEDLAQLPASERIRYRVVGADRRYHANDNIAEFVRPGEARAATPASPLRGRHPPSR